MASLTLRRSPSPLKKAEDLMQAPLKEADDLGRVEKAVALHPFPFCSACSACSTLLTFAGEASAAGTLGERAMMCGVRSGWAKNQMAGRLHWGRRSLMLLGAKIRGARKARRARSGH